MKNIAVLVVAGIFCLVMSGVIFVTTSDWSKAALYGLMPAGWCFFFAALRRKSLRTG